LYVERRTPAWIGGYPDITVDTNAASPNFGTVYVAYNWLADAVAGPGLAVLASADGGRSWQIAQVSRVGMSGYPAPGGSTIACERRPTDRLRGLLRRGHAPLERPAALRLGGLDNVAGSDLPLPTSITIASLAA